jgi:hypothetical protein
MGWKYGIVRILDRSEVTYGVCEVFDLPEGVGFTGPVDVIADSANGLASVLRMMSDDINQALATGVIHDEEKWKTGDAAEFLGLTPEEEAQIDARIAQEEEDE